MPIDHLDLTVNHYAGRRTVSSRDTAWSDAERAQYAEILVKLRQLVRQRKEHPPSEPKPGDPSKKPPGEPPLDRQALARELVDLLPGKL